MTDEALKFISEELTDAGINYEFGEWTTDPVPDPYFVGEYLESPSTNEDGLQEASFILTGTGRNSWLALELSKATIKQLFNQISGKTAILSNGNGVAVFYSDSSIIPTGDAELKRIQINLSIKEWSVN